MEDKYKLFANHPEFEIKKKETAVFGTNFVYGDYKNRVVGADVVVEFCDNLDGRTLYRVRAESVNIELYYNRQQTISSSFTESIESTPSYASASMTIDNGSVSVLPLWNAIYTLRLLTPSNSNRFVLRNCYIQGISTDINGNSILEIISNC